MGEFKEHILLCHLQTITPNPWDDCPPAQRPAGDREASTWLVSHTCSFGVWASVSSPLGDGHATQVDCVFPPPWFTLGKNEWYDVFWRVAIFWNLPRVVPVVM